MSIRVGLYDFFAYTLPGVFYLSIIGFWLNAIDLLVIDFSALKDFSRKPGTRERKTSIA